MKPLQSILSHSVTVFLLVACVPQKKIESAVKQVSFDPPALVQGEFKPEHFAMLFPLDFSQLDKPQHNGGGAGNANHNIVTENVKFVHALNRQLVPMSAVMSEEFYRNVLIQNVVEDAQKENEFSDSNPLALQGTKELFNGVALEEWFVTAVRFVPCDEPFYSLPRKWYQVTLDEPQFKARRAYELVCRPRIRLSVQRFGLSPEIINVGGQPTFLGSSDDKAFHLIFDYIGNTEELREVFRKSFATEVGLVSVFAGPEGMASQEVRKALVELYTPGDLVAGLDALKLNFIEMVKALHSGTNGASFDKLRKNFGGGQANPSLEAVKKFIREDLLKVAVFTAASQNLTVTPAETTPGGTPGENFKSAQIMKSTAALEAAIAQAQIDSKSLKPIERFSIGFAQIWLLGAFRYSSDILKSLASNDPAARKAAWEQTAAFLKSERNPAKGILERAELKFIFDDNGTEKNFSFGMLESFEDTGGPAAVDADFILTAKSLDMDLSGANQIWKHMGMQQFGQIGEGRTSSPKTGKRHPSVRPNAGTVGEDSFVTEEVSKGIAAVLDTRSHSISHPSCVSCHLVGGVRANNIEKLKIAYPNQLSEADFVATYNMDLVGPGKKLVDVGQASFSKTWNMRGFGYFGRIPTISDRLILEVNDDVSFANTVTKK